MSISETTFPSSNYNALSEKIRQKASPSLKCSLFCGGVNCKYCGSDKWTKEDQALNGFYSNWITEDILAMARPNTKAIEKHGLFESFEKNGIKTIINLQERNEHASCGQPLTDSGFSYDPQDFMNQQIYYYNYEWKDYLCVPSTLLLDMVKVVDFSLKEGKVAVHCHAGLGRTGVLIAAYILYKNPNLRPQDVIYYIRKKRKGSIQTKLQIEGVFKFYTFIQPLISSLFPTNVQSTTLEGLLHRQKYLLHGPEYRKLKYIPKFVFLVIERLKQLLREEEVYKKRKNGRKKKRKRVKKMKRNQRKDPRKDGEEEEEEDGQTASASSFLFLPLIKATGNDENKSSDLIEFETQIIGKIRKFEKLDKSTDSLTSLIEKTLGYRLIGNGNKEEEKERKKEEPDEEEEEEEEKEDEEEKSSGFISNDEVEVEAEDEDEGDDEDEKYDINKIIVWNFIHDFRMFQLNLGGHLDELKKGDTKVVTEEEDPTVLLSLLFTFFQNLKASFLNEESLTRIVTNRKLDKIRETTLEYLLDFLCLIQVVDEVEEDLIVKRLITELCRQSIRLSDGSVIPSHSNYPPLRCGTQKILFNFIQQAFYSRQSSPLLNSL